MFRVGGRIPGLRHLGCATTGSALRTSAGAADVDGPQVGDPDRLVLLDGKAHFVVMVPYEEIAHMVAAVEYCGEEVHGKMGRVFRRLGRSIREQLKLPDGF